MAPRQEQNPMTNWVYDVFLWTFAILVDLFFREVHPRGSWKIPRRGPVIFVAAPHANQVCWMTLLDFICCGTQEESTGFLVGVMRTTC
jgi:1-acyl-sn-glycerol-3-phosphate acyltransferase